MLLATAVGAFHLVNPSMAPRMNQLAMELSADRHFRAFGTLVRSLAELDPRMLRLLGLGSALYALVFYVEGIGLFYDKVWAEQMTIITTGGLIPFELFELNRHASPEKVGVLVANVLILAYLVRRVTRKEPA